MQFLEKKKKNKIKKYYAYPKAVFDIIDYAFA